MEHVVFYTGPDRAPAFRRTPSLDEAVRFVESLRNGEGIDDSKVYSLTEIPLRFQTYYRVEVPADAVGGAGPAQAQQAPTAASEQLSPPSPTAAAAAPVPAPEPARAPDTAPPVVEVVAQPAPDPAAAVGAEPTAESAGAAVDTASEDDGAEGAVNGRPNRGLGFFAR